jgi:hypothetical protein
MTELTMPKDADKPSDLPESGNPAGPEPKVHPIPSEEPILRWPHPSDFVPRPAKAPAGGK